MAGDAPSASSRIFISYRRDDAQWPVEALYQKLQQHFGDRIFKDTDNIAPGQDFAEVINRELESCSVLLAVIGARWLTTPDPKSKRPRLENPTDTLRLEISTALKNERVLVIPVLVDGASMPGTDDLPSDLDPLARRNGIDIGVGSKFDSDVNRLIKAIERATGMTATAKRQPVQAPPIDMREPADEPVTEEFNLREIRRRRQIADHVKAAQAAFEAQDYEAVLEASDRALFLDPQEATARTLHRQARTAIDNSKIQKWLGEAEKILGREPLEDTDLGRASELVDEALALNAAHEAAVKLRQEVLSLRKKRERQRDIAKQVRAVLTRAQSCLDEEDFDGAIEFCDDALLLSEESVEARDLRARAVAAKDEEKRQKDLKRRAQQAVKESREDLAAGKHEAALRRLEQFSPPHDLVERALEELRDAMDARALSEVANARRLFASGDHAGAIARLDGFQPPHAAVTRALTDLRAEVQQIALDEQARRRDEEARAEAERVGKAIADALRESSASLDRRDFDAALAHARAALQLDAASREAQQAVAEAEKAVARHKEVTTGLRDVRSLLKAARFPAAIETLTRIAALDPRAEGLAALEDEAEAGQRAERLRHEVDEQLAAARKARAAGDLAGALQAVTAALARDASHAGAAALERELQAAVEADEIARREALTAKQRAEEDARLREADETARRKREEEEETARRAKEEADRKARDAKAKEDEARRKREEEAARQAKEEADRKARDAKAKEDEARRKKEEEAARQAKEEADRKARDAKAKEDEARRKKEEEAARQAKQEADRKARDAKAKEDEARRKKEEEAARQAKQEADRKAREARQVEEARQTPEVEPAIPEPAEKRGPNMVVIGGIGAAAAAIALVVWLQSGSTDTTSTPPTTSSGSSSAAPVSPPPAGPARSASTETTKQPETTADAGKKAEPAPPPSNAAPAAATPPAPETAPPAAPAADPRALQLQGFRTAALDAWQRGDARTAANSLVSAMKMAPGNPETWNVAVDLMRQSEQKMRESRKVAIDAKAQSTRAYQEGESKAAEGERSANGPGVKGGPRGRPVEAFRDYSAAVELFKKAATEAAAAAPPVATPPPASGDPVGSMPKPIATPPKPDPTVVIPPVETVKPPSSSPIKPPPSAAATSTPPPAAAPAASSAAATSAPQATPWAAEDAAIRAVLSAYETATSTLDPEAVARVQILSGDAKKRLKDSFAQMKENHPKVTIESIKPSGDGQQAIVVSKVLRDFTPKGGGGRTTMTIATIFTMRKTPAGWMIAEIK